MACDNHPPHHHNTQMNLQQFKQLKRRVTTDSSHTLSFVFRNFGTNALTQFRCFVPALSHESRTKVTPYLPLPPRSSSRSRCFEMWSELRLVDLNSLRSQPPGGCENKNRSMPISQRKQLVIQSVARDNRLVFQELIGYGINIKTTTTTMMGDSSINVK